MQGDANVVQIHGGHGLKRAVGQELCHGGPGDHLLHEHDQSEVDADRGCHSLREGEVVNEKRLKTCHDSTEVTVWLNAIRAISTNTTKSIEALLLCIVVHWHDEVVGAK